ncbi:MAG: hypothetical protein IPP72_08800 [Chitinophagaceae bacterium]|nr:hypothetical protein [Chitinophagaceae bacterium]
MKQTNLKYITVLFLITLFIVKGILATLPALLPDEADQSWIENVLSAATDEGKKSTEERSEQENKALYLDNNCFFDLAAMNIDVDQKDIRANKIQYKQSVYISIPTPPPEL